jgi:hypothetical protein
MLITIQSVVDAAINLSDMKYSNYIDTANTPTSEMMQYVNLAYRDLYQQIIMSKELYFVQQYSFGITSESAYYPLPTDFYKLQGVDLVLEGERHLTLQPFMFSERNKYRSNFAVPVAPYGAVYKYLIFSDKIQFIPQPSSNNQIVIWYTPEPVTITNFSTSLNLPIGSGEYLTW